MSPRVIDLDQSPTVARIKSMARRAWSSFVYSLELSGQAWFHAHGFQPERKDA